MAIKDYIKPYTDDNLIYDYENHRYILTHSRADFGSALDLNELWGGADNVEWYLDYVSNVVYTYISSFLPPHLYKKLVYYLSHSKEMRKAVEEIMIDTIIYNFEDGGFLVAYQTGVNLKEMKELPMKIEMAVSVVGENIVRKYGLQDRNFRIAFDVEHETYGTEW